MPDSPDDFRYILLEETASTNADAMRLAVGGEALPVWVIAERQTAGRGRAGRLWVSPAGNFTASVALTCRAPLEKAGQLSLVAGISVIDAIRATTPLAPDVELRLKWPNDVLIGVAKVGGILVESTTARGSPGFVAVMGFGVNLVSSPPDIGRAAAIGDFSPPPERLALLKALHGSLSDWSGRWADGDDFATIRDAWMERAGPFGEAITINTTDGPVSGTYEGLAEGGALLARVDGAVRIISYGDVALAPTAGRNEAS